MSSLHSVTGLLLEWASEDNEVRECPLQCSVKTTEDTEILSQLGRKNGLQNSDCLKSTVRFSQNTQDQDFREAIFSVVS